MKETGSSQCSKLNQDKLKLSRMWHCFLMRHTCKEIDAHLSFNQGYFSIYIQRNSNKDHMHISKTNLKTFFLCVWSVKLKRHRNVPRH